MILLPIADAVTDLIVRRRLQEAFITLRRMPANSWRGYRLANGAGLLGDEPEPRMHDGRKPTASEISEADEAFDWLTHLRHADEAIRRAVQMKAMGLSLRQIGLRLGVSHVSAGHLEARGVAAIVAALRKFDLLPGLSTLGRRMV